MSVCVWVFLSGIQRSCPATCIILSEVNSASRVARATVADKSVIVGIEPNSMQVHFRFVPVRLMKQLHFLNNVFHALAPVPHSR